MGWRSDIARGVYGNLPRTLMNRNQFPAVEVNCNQIHLPCPNCGSGLPCLDISSIDARDKHVIDVRARIGLRLPIYPQHCPTCGCTIVYDGGEA